MKIIGLCILLTAGLTRPALAQDKAADATPGDGSQPQASATQRFDFEDDQVEGDIQRPDGELISSIEKAKEESLIEIRRNFVPEILKMIEDL